MTSDSRLLCQYRGRSILLDPQRKSSIGTDLSCDVVLEGLDGGRQWAMVRMISGWYVEPVNGTEVAFGDGPWSDRLAWLKGDGPVSVRLRRNGAEISVTVSQVPADQYPPVPASAGTVAASHAPEPAPPLPSSAPPIPIPDTPVGEWFTIGREGGPAYVKLPGPDVALLHARVRRQSDGSVDIRDQSLGLGILVDGRPVLSERIPPGGSFVIGHHRLMAVPGKFTVGTVRQSPVLECHDLMVTYQREEEPSLVSIDFVLNTHEFMTVIGPSSAGKSTLFRALLGEVENVRGSVRFSWGALPADGPPGGLVSFVPQDDHLPSDLTIRQAIRFAARLRLAPDLPRAEFNQRTDQVMARLDLTRHAGTDVGKASGGTRKRVSLALELLSDPVLLILDEPTSGLDEGLDRRLMRQLADLAREGAAILLVTHSMANLDESDQVLAINGRKTTGYCGSPQAMRQAFGTQSYADVMDNLRDGRAVTSVQPTAGTTAAAQGGRTFLQRARRRQIPVLAMRELRRFAPSGGLGHLLAKPGLHLLLAPLVVAMLSCLVGSHGLATSKAFPNTQLTEVLSILSITTAFFAAALTSGSIVSDFEMIRREARWGIRARSVVMSRFLVFGLVALLQGVLASLIFLVLRPGPSDEELMPGPLLMIVTVSLLCLASAVAGLFVSALARSVQQGVFALMMLSVIQVVLSGLIIPLGQPTNAGIWLLNGLSWVTPIRWATAALGSGIGINSLPGTTPDGLWSHSLAHVAGAWLALVVLTLVFLSAAASILSARLRRRL
jgi:ABC-type multidrug transport system ATPase subunit